MATVKQITEISKEDLTEVITGLLNEKAEAKAYDKYYNVLVPISWVSTIHKVKPVTVRRYIERGLIVPEERGSREEHYQFRLSSVLRMDFNTMRKQFKRI